MKRRARRSLAAIATTAFLAMGVVMAPSASATPLGWTGAASGSWATTTNWSPAQAPVNGDVLSFPASATTLNMQNDVGANTALQLNFNGAGYTLSGNTIDLQALTQSVAGTNQIFTPITSTVANLPVSVPAGGTVALNGAVGGSSGILKTGLGKLILAGANTYTGVTAVGAGSVIVNGSINSSQTQVTAGLLGGSGSTGAVVATGGFISPGDGGAGLLTVNGPLGLSSGVTVQLDILGAAPGTLHDALTVTGGVVLNNAVLVLAGNFSAPSSTQFVVINNTSAASVQGTFAGLPEGTTFPAANGFSYKITYQGGIGNNDVVLTQTGKGVTVLAGVDRVETAVNVSKNSFPGAGSANAVVLARGDLFPDALAGSPLAVVKGGPLLLTSLVASTGIDVRTTAEIQRVLSPGKTIFILGGEVAISAAVFTQLQSLGYAPVRLGGADRFDTAILIAQNGLNNPTNILLATGLNFPDALAAGAAAAKVNGAVLLTNGNVQPPANQTYLAAHPSDVLFAVGGFAAAAVPTAQSISGIDRYDTAVKVAQKFFTNPTTVGLASGVNFPDGLTGGAHIGRLGGPLVLTDPNALPAFTSSYLTSIASTVTSGFVYGGTNAIAANVVSAFKVAIGAPA